MEISRDSSIAVDEKRRKFDKVKNDQNKIGEIYQELQPLQMALNSGLFSEGSIFSKTLKKVLAHEQATGMKRWSARRDCSAIGPRSS